MKSYDSKDWEKSEHSKLETRIIHEKRGQKRKIYTLKELINKDYHNEEIKVICQFVECFSSFKKALKCYDSEKNVQNPFDSGKGEYIHIHYVITDENLQGDVFNVYVYTYDKRGLEFLPGLDPSKIYGSNTLNSIKI